MTPRNVFRALVLAGAVCTVGTLAACGDDFFDLNWSSSPDTTVLFSLARPEINLPSGFDFTVREAIRIQDPDVTGDWDILIDTEGASLVMKVPAVFGIDSDARVSTFPGMAFRDVIEAPEDTADYTADPVTLELGNVYVIQTHLAPDRFGQRCHFFAKMEPLAIDVQQGTLEFVFDRNPLCEDLELVPEEER